ncbi:response regulator transcription factor [Tolumonas lignilytica]|jgi:Response regulators consisting of a CheY-like receiver domain and a winged-helix DNA-binding domain|uniref:response regulator transcription factor n=1 Tax=Tolumonas lignilytica TaxID=1283284 RepID=UPI00046789CF|nr:response regulator transcription factor [Tolumonas lignilytica]
MRVLLVEDDRMIGEAVELALKDAKYAVDWVRDGLMAINTLECQTYDLVLLDLGLPKKDGFEVLKTIRDRGNEVSLLIMTARDATQDRIRGLDLGADDYIVKPFEIGELLARMRAVSRRKGGTARPVLTNGVITLDPATHEATVNDHTITLTGREFAILQALLVRPGAILSRSELEERMYGWNEEIESNVVEFMISSLRKKLGSKDLIKNIRGVGWMVSKDA